MPQTSHDSLWILTGLGAAWCLVIVALLVMAFRRHQAPRFDFHWGSLGRGLGGWEISWSLVLAVVALVLTIGTVTAAVESIAPSNKPNADAAKQGSADAGKKEGGAKGDGTGPSGEGKSDANPSGASPGNSAPAPETGEKSLAKPSAAEGKGKPPAAVAGGKKGN